VVHHDGPELGTLLPLIVSVLQFRRSFPPNRPMALVAEHNVPQLFVMEDGAQIEVSREVTLTTNLSGITTKAKARMSDMTEESLRTVRV